MSKKNKLGDAFFMDTIINTVRTYEMYLNQIIEMCISQFEWVNIPPEIDKRFLEITLLKNSKIAFFKDELVGYIVQPFTQTGSLDIYNNPININIHAVNGYNRNLKKDEYVIIYNNLSRSNVINQIELFANKLCLIDRITMVNVNAQKTPVLIKCDEKQRLTLKNLFKEFDGCEPVIFGDKSLLPDNISILNLNAPFLADKLYELRKKVWYELLDFIGIPYAPEKKERLVVDEVNANNSDKSLIANSKLIARQLAVDDINRMFGLNIVVRERKEVHKNYE